MRKFLLVFVFVFSAFPLLAQERHGPYKIHKFVDGDTFWVKMDAGKTEKIRLIGVDTPGVNWLKKTKPGSLTYVRDDRELDSVKVLFFGLITN